MVLLITKGKSLLDPRLGKGGRGLDGIVGHQPWVVVACVGEHSHRSPSAHGPVHRVGNDTNLLGLVRAHPLATAVSLCDATIIVNGLENHPEYWPRNTPNHWNMYRIVLRTALHRTVVDNPGWSARSATLNSNSTNSKWLHACSYRSPSVWWSSWMWPMSCPDWLREQIGCCQPVPFPFGSDQCRWHRLASQSFHGALPTVFGLLLAWVFSIWWHRFEKSIHRHPYGEEHRLKSFKTAHILTQCNVRQWAQCPPWATFPSTGTCSSKMVPLWCAPKFELDTRGPHGSLWSSPASCPWWAMWLIGCQLDWSGTAEWWVWPGLGVFVVAWSTWCVCPFLHINCSMFAWDNFALTHSLALILVQAVFTVSWLLIDCTNLVFQFFPIPKKKICCWLHLAPSWFANGGFLLPTNQGVEHEARVSCEINGMDMGASECKWMANQADCLGKSFLCVRSVAYVQINCDYVC